MKRAVGDMWRLGMLAVSCGLVLSARAGGNALNTVVVVNRDSTNSCELGNYYCERRQVPPDNLLRIYWQGPNTSWTSSDFQTNLLQPLLAMLAARQLTNQVDYVVLSMDIPFQTVNGSTVNSTTAALFYGLKPDTNGSPGNINSYCSSETVFRQNKPAMAPGYSFLATMITANSLDQARQLVDQGASSDGTFPRQSAVLEKTSDTSRNIRYSGFDNALFNTRLLGKSSLVRTNSDWPPAPPPAALGLQTGLANFSVASNAFVPGAMADSLTSYGGVIFGPNDQTSLLAFIGAGAAGSYGTVAEPYSDTQKFPNPQDYFYQARGFSLAECYYQSIYDPFLGLIVADPLAAPFALTGSGQWGGASSNAVLSATAQLSLSFDAAYLGHPLQQIDLFVDGKYAQTLTNLGPTAGNQLTLKLAGYPVSYTVPTNATLAMVVTGLVAQINTPAITNVTKVQAFSHGDRIELRSLSTNYQADPFYYLDATTSGTSAYYRVSYLPFPTVPQLATAGLDQSGGLRMHLETTPGVPSIILASTNLADWLPIATNLPGGELDFVDPCVTGYPQRFYRVSSPDQRQKLSLIANTNGGAATVHVQSQTSLTYTLEVSTNLADWTALTTNSAGGTMDFIDPQAVSSPGRFYRTVASPPTLPPASVTVLPPPVSGGNLVSITGAARRYRLLGSTNLLQWTSLLTNLSLSGGQVAATSSPGTAATLSTFLSASQPTFLDSLACGIRAFYLNGTTQVGSWLQLSITKTNGLMVSLAVTNQSTGGTLASLTQQLLAAVNSSPDLQGSDGLAGEDFMTDAFGAPSFHLRALSAGYNAAALRVWLTASSDVSLSPFTQVTLTQNLSDLQPRNHLYVSAGASTLAIAFPLDTTTLPDGFHELTAVAYEGTHVHTQTKAVLPVQIHNSPLSATLTLTDLTNGAPVQATYHVMVAGNTNTVSAISLFSTGGLLAAATNQSTATFIIDGTALGAGLHPFYALIQTGDGLQYRTQSQWVRLVNGP